MVRDDGTYTVTRTRPAVTRSGQLTATELADLRQALAGAHLDAAPGKPSGAVADGFTYRLGYGGARVLTQDGAFGEPLRSVIARLTGIVER